MSASSYAVPMHLQRRLPELESYINSHYPNTEVYLLYGGQPIYDYIIILE